MNLFKDVLTKRFQRIYLYINQTDYNRRQQIHSVIITNHKFLLNYNSYEGMYSKFKFLTLTRNTVT